MLVAPTHMPPTKSSVPFYRSTFFLVLLAACLGVMVGMLWPDTGRSLKPLGDAFV